MLGSGRGKPATEGSDSAGTRPESYQRYQEDCEGVAFSSPEGVGVALQGPGQVKIPETDAAQPDSNICLASANSVIFLILHRCVAS